MTQSQVLGSYSPEEVTIVISNAQFSHIIGGYTDGTFVSVSRTIPHATPYVGADASHARVIRKVKSADITITLNQASESNDVLSQLLQKDEQFADNTWLFNIIIKDNSGRTMYSASKSYIGTVPDSDFGVEITDRPWVIHAINMETHLGGNSELTADGFNTLQELDYDVIDRWKPTV